jgi:hypothetical protein
MATQSSYFETDILKTELDTVFNVTFTFSGTDYVGQKDETTESFAMQDAGFQSDIKFDLICRASLFTIEPEDRDLITIATVVYRVQGKRTSQDGLLLTLPLTKNN